MEKHSLSEPAAVPPAAGATALDSASRRDGKSAGKDGEASKRIDLLRREFKELAGRAAISAGEAEFFARDREKLGAIRQLYRRLEPTMEWAENNYYHLPIQQQVADLVGVSPFWLDYARHDGKGPFLSRHLADASRNFTELILALSVLDLPFEAPKHEVVFKDGRMTLTPAGPMVAFHEEVRPVAGPAGATPILISQNFYRHGDRFREENGEKLDKFITGEFLVHTIYGCQVVVTNPTSARQRLSVLIQIPVGAIPVGNGQFTKTVLLDLEPYRTQAIDYLFYSRSPAGSSSFRSTWRRTSSSSLRPRRPPSMCWSSPASSTRPRGNTSPRTAPKRKCWLSCVAKTCTPWIWRRSPFA
jgi:hypothetical protein